MQEELFSIELKGHSYLFVFGNIVCAKVDNKLNYTANNNNGNRGIGKQFQNACINRANIYIKY